MATADVVREAALYLEYFLKGLSECNVIGSYAVQFLELNSLSPRLESSLAGHLLYLLDNMKRLLMKLDTSLIQNSDIYRQQDDPTVCKLCNRDLCALPKDNLLQNEKANIEENIMGKSYESPEINQLFSPMIHLKEEIPLELVHHSKEVQPSIKDVSTNVIQIESSETRDPISIVNCSTSSDIKDDKCNVTVFDPSLDDGLKIEYAPTEHLEEDQGEILLEHVDGAEVIDSDGLMYSIYSMNSGGSLQLVSRVLSKNAMIDTVNEPVEKAMIEINNLKDESDNSIEVLTLQEDAAKDHDSNVKQSVVRLLPDQRGKIFSKSSRRKEKSKVTIDSDLLENISPKFKDVCEMGPEDLEGAKWCQICEKEFPSVGSLKSHISRTHSTSNWCHTCNKSLGSELMSSHVSTVHGDIPFVCKICGKSLTSNGGFQRHMDTHKGLRGSACEVCGQTFSRTEYYKEHIRIHTGEKPFECETCKKTFARSSNLKAHMRIHDKKSRYECSLCTKSFARADKLKEHAARHLHVKPFTCRLCTKSYWERRDLVKHIKKLHPTDQDHEVAEIGL